MRYSRFLVLTLVGIGLLYLFTLEVNHSEAEDALDLLLKIQTESFYEQFNPNHLLYGPLNWVWYQLWVHLGYQGTAELSVQLVNIAFALMGLFFLFRISTQLSFPPTLASFVCLATAFSYGFWQYSVGCDTYILPIPFLLLTLDRLLYIAKSPISSSSFFLLALFHTLTTLSHQQHVLLTVPILATWGWIAYSRSLGSLAFFRYSLVYLATMTLFTLGTYIAVTILISGSDTPISWALGHARNGLWSPLRLTSPILGAIGMLRAIVGLHWVFSFSWVEALVDDFLRQKSLVEEIFLVQNLSLITQMICSIGVGILALFFLYTCMRLFSLKNFFSTPQRRTAFVFSLTYLTAYALFNILWEPINLEFWISLLPFFYLVVFVTLERCRPSVLALFVFALLMTNLQGSILPATKRGNDYWYTYHKWLIENSEEADLIISGGPYLGDAYLRFYTKANILPIYNSGSFEELLAQTIDRDDPKRTLVLPSVLSAPSRNLGQRQKKNFLTNQKLFLTQKSRPLHESKSETVWIYDFGKETR